MKKTIIAIYLLLMILHYPGCMGYWSNKYPYHNHNNVWEDRGFCAALTLIPIAGLFVTGFYHRGFSY